MRLNIVLLVLVVAEVVVVVVKTICDLWQKKKNQTLKLSFSKVFTVKPHTLSGPVWKQLF